MRSGHAVYKTIMTILTRWAANISWLPIGAIALRAIIAAMFEWWRKAELSADRAGLLAGQDPAASLRLMMKLAGGGDLSQIDTAAFLEQAAEYEGGGDLRDSIHKIGMTAWSSHPVPVARAAELRKWVDSGEYAPDPRRRLPAPGLATATPRSARTSRRPPSVVPGRRSPPRRIRWSAWCGGSAAAPPTWPGPAAGKAHGWASDGGRGRGPPRTTDGRRVRRTA